MYSKIIKDIAFPLYEIKRPSDERYITHINFLNKTQWWSYSDLQKLQMKRLKKLLSHAYINVPFYHNMFKKINFDPNDFSSINDLNKIPILTKEIINNNFNNLYAQNYVKEDLIQSSTSGSTGSPMLFYTDRKWNACNTGAAYRAWSWAGYEPGNKIAYLWGAPWDIKEKGMIDKIRNYLFRTINLDAFNLTEENMATYVKILKKFKPKVINTYASVIFLFARYLQKEGIDYIKPKSILTTADMLYKNQRETIENVFDCEVFDYYSGRETTLQAAECSEHSGYHLSIENAVVEFIKEKEHVSPGETGKIIITDLCNYAMPFIRYEIGDLGRPTDEKCPCGRNLPLMKSMKGRIFDFIITPEGNYIPGEFFHFIIIDYDIHGIKEFQIQQPTIDKLIVNIVKNPDEKTNDVTRFINLIQKKVGEKVEVELKYKSAIKRTPSGKLRHIISNIHPIN